MRPAFRRGCRGALQGRHAPYTSPRNDCGRHCCGSWPFVGRGVSAVRGWPAATSPAISTRTESATCASRQEKWISPGHKRIDDAYDNKTYSTKLGAAITDN